MQNVKGLISKYVNFKPMINLLCIETALIVIIVGINAVFCK